MPWKLSSFLLLAISLSAQAQWPATGASHPLGYFETDTFQLKRVGTLAGFKIWDLFQTHEDKLILVQTGADRYLKLFDVDMSNPVALPVSETRIVRSGTELILATRDSDGGHGGGCIEGYWWFDRKGPHAIDFQSLQPRIAAHFPPGAVFKNICLDVDLAKQLITGEVKASEDICRACEEDIVEVAVGFRLHGARVELTDIPSRWSFRH